MPNVGYEAGVYLRFVMDHYDDLPEQMAFIQDQPEMHNRQWLEWIQCLLPEREHGKYQGYAPLVHVRLLSRDFRNVKDGLHAVA